MHKHVSSITRTTSPNLRLVVNASAALPACRSMMGETCTDRLQWLEEQMSVAQARLESLQKERKQLLLARWRGLDADGKSPLA